MDGDGRCCTNIDPRGLGRCPEEVAVSRRSPSWAPQAVAYGVEVIAYEMEAFAYGPEAIACMAEVVACSLEAVADEV